MLEKIEHFFQIMIKASACVRVCVAHIKSLSAIFSSAVIEIIKNISLSGQAEILKSII